MSEESLDEFIARFKQRFPKEEKIADPVGDWLFAHKYQFSYQWESKTTPFPFAEIEEYIAPMGGTMRDPPYDFTFTHTLTYPWASRNESTEKRIAGEQWVQSVHALARDRLIACRQDQIVCSAYRIKADDLKPVTHTSGKFFGKKELMSSTITVQYQLYRKR